MALIKQTKINIIIVGAGKAGQLLAKNIIEDNSTPFKVIGFIDDDPKKQQKINKGIRVLGTVNDLKQVIDSHSIREVFIAIRPLRLSIQLGFLQNQLFLLGLTLIFHPRVNLRL